jgi:radical SAM superfamily enzyme YgiQ (UPF0313 family)
MNILLIQPRTKKFYVRSFESGGQNSHPPVGLQVLAGSLRCHGHQVQILDMLLHKVSRTQFSDLLETFKPDLVGITVMTEYFSEADKIAAEVRKKLTNCWIVIGGAFASFEFETVMQNEAVDFVVRFEGEDTVLELLEHLQYPEFFRLNQIPGLVYRTADGLQVNPRRQPNKRLDAQPFPDREVLPPEGYTHGGTISSGRGCGYHCIFCSSSAVFGTAARMRTAENLFAEIYYLYKHFGIQEFYFVDQAFTASRRRTRALCNYLLVGKLDIRWRCLSRVDAVSPELLDLMVRAGCREIEFGVESGDPAVLEKIDKGITPEKILETIAIATKLGLKVVCFFMLGHHADTIDSMKRTIEFALNLVESYSVQVIPRINTPFPGTFQYEHAAELGLRIHADCWEDYSYVEPIISNSHFTQEQLRELYVDFVQRIDWCQN